jgi:hypothetical protein
MDDIDRSIAERASQQLGLVSRADCARLGLSTRMLRRRVGTGRLYPVGNQVLRLAGTPTSWESDVLAACLETNSVASHRTVAALHGLEGFASSPPFSSRSPCFGAATTGRRWPLSIPRRTCRRPTS